MGRGVAADRGDEPERGVVGAERGALHRDTGVATDERRGRAGLVHRVCRGDLPGLDRRRLAVRERPENEPSSGDERQALSVGRERRWSGVAREDSRLLVRAEILAVERVPRTGDSLAAVFVPRNRRPGADEGDGGEIGRDGGGVHADGRVDEGAEQLLDTPRLGIDLRKVAAGRNQEPVACPDRPAG